MSHAKIESLVIQEDKSCSRRAHLWVAEGPALRKPKRLQRRTHAEPDALL